MARKLRGGSGGKIVAEWEQGSGSQGVRVVPCGKGVAAWKSGKRRVVVVAKELWQRSCGVAAAAKEMRSGSRAV